MKRLVVLTVLLVSFSGKIFSSEFMMNGVTTQYDYTALGQVTSLSPCQFASDREQYINGGLTFSYPDGLWINVPRVVATVELNGAASATTTYSVVITSNSATSTTVMVYRIANGGIVTEADSNEVKVAIYALENFA
jgi:hypothetical protein